MAGELATDGRLARGRRTRRNVADALVALLQAGDPDPTAKAVAARVGVSLRLVFHHFADMDDLYHLVAALQLRRLWSGVPRLSSRLSLTSRIERTVAHRAALFEEISPVRHALARRGPFSPAVAQAIAVADNLLRESLRATFAPELTELAPAVRAKIWARSSASTSWELWERLRGMSGTGVRAPRPRHDPHGDRALVAGAGNGARNGGGTAGRGAWQAGDLGQRKLAGPLEATLDPGVVERGQPLTPAPSSGLTPPSAVSSPMRRRTSTARGAGYPSSPGRHPAAIFWAPAPSSVQMWQVLVRKLNPPSRIGVLPAPLFDLPGA